MKGNRLNGGAAACAAALLCALASPAMADTPDADGFAFTPVEADNGASGFSVTSIAISNLNQIAITTETGVAEFSSAAPGADPTRVFSQVTDFQSAEQQINGINAAHNAVGFFNDAPMLMGGAPRDLGGDNGEDSFIAGTSAEGISPPVVLVAPGATALVTKAFGINDENVVVGDYQTSADGKFHGFIESGGVYTAIDISGAFDTFAQGINNSGDVVGYFEDASGVHGFIDVGGVITVLNVPGANTQTSLGTFAEGINDEGEVVGYFDDSLRHTHGFIESGGVYTTFDDPSANAGTTKAFGINDAGDIVGAYQFTEVVDGVAGSTIANGFYATPLAAAAPEPSTWAMLLVGFAGLGFMGWRVSRRGDADASQAPSAAPAPSFNRLVGPQASRGSEA